LTGKTIPTEDNAAAIEDPRAKAEELLKAALSKKAFNPVLMDLRHITTLADYFLIMSGSSAKHVTAVAQNIMEHAKRLQIQRFSSEGIQQGNWALMDYGDVIVHVFQPSVREFYDLEGLWSEAPRVEFSGDLAGEVEAARQASDDDESFSYED